MSMHTPGAPGRGDVSVKVHDGRKDRDPDLVDPKTGLGELLVQFMAAVPFRVGDQVAGHQHRRRLSHLAGVQLPSADPARGPSLTLYVLSVTCTSC
jgi:hypothetical protein